MDTTLAIIILAAVSPVVYWLYVANSKGAPYVQTPMPAVKKMLKLARIQPGEIVCDIGCGDGRLVILADQEYQAQAIGFELSPPIYIYAKLLHWIKRTKTEALILFKDSRHINLGEVDVVVLFMMPKPLREFWKQKFEHELKPSARVISYAFSIQGWTPCHTEPKQPELNVGPIYVYQMDKLY